MSRTARADVLTLELELLTGVYRASLPDGSAAEWPPHPERLFSALVQAWGDGDRDAAERSALEWLEGLPPPEIEASPDGEHSERTAPTVYVPPNDARSGDLEILPGYRRGHERSFRASIPSSPMVRFTWSEAPDQETLRALRALTSRVVSVGHSASLTRLSVLGQRPSVDASRVWRPAEEGDAVLRIATAGRLADLERWFADGGEGWTRPLSRATQTYRRPSGRGAEEVPKSVFGAEPSWYVFEDDGEGFRPDLLGFAHVARLVRDALMSRSRQPVPEVISGHGSGGDPSERPHLAVVPLASVGWERQRSGGELLGFAVVLPRAIESEEREATLAALSKLISFKGGRGTCTLLLPNGKQWTLERSPDPSRASLRPARWCREARIWASVTPVLLDRYPEDDDPAETARLIAGSCRHVGLPEPMEIEVHKHSAVSGAPSAYPGRGRRWPDWTFPAGSKLADRPRRHVVLRFASAVQGPVLLGAGRYHGFGLLLPLEGNR